MMNVPYFVIPVKTGIQKRLDSCLRRNDNSIVTSRYQPPNKWRWR
jgi:hypothetical protein